MIKRRTVIDILLLLIIVLIVYLLFFVHRRRPLTIRLGPGAGITPEEMFLDYNETRDGPLKGIPWQDAQ